MAVPVMKHASVKQRNAVFDAVYKELEEKWLPKLQWPIHDRAKAALEGPEGRQGVLDLVDVALKAYEETEE